MQNQSLTPWARHFVAIGLSTLALAAAAQAVPGNSPYGGPPAARSSVEAQKQSQAVLGRYVSGLAGQQERVDALAHMMSLGLARNAQNTTTLRSILGRNADEEEKVLAVRLLADQFDRSNPTGMNHLILADLKQQGNSASPRVAGEAIVSYARLGYLPDSMAVLKAGRERGVLNEDDYFGELAHMLESAPAAEQLEMARMIRASRNGYGRDVVAAVVISDLQGALRPETKQELARLLEENEPQLGANVREYDGIQAVFYQDWLRALALLKASDFNKNGAEVIMQRLSAPMMDTRKLYAFFTSPYAPEMLAQIPQRDRYTIMIQRMVSYPKQFPDDRRFGELAARSMETLMQHTR